MVLNMVLVMLLNLVLNLVLDLVWNLVWNLVLDLVLYRWLVGWSFNSVNRDSPQQSSECTGDPSGPRLSNFVSFLKIPEIVETMTIVPL